MTNCIVIRIYVSERGIYGYIFHTYIAIMAQPSISDKTTWLTLQPCAPWQPTAISMAEKIPMLELSLFLCRNWWPEAQL